MTSAPQRQSYRLSKCCYVLFLLLCHWVCCPLCPVCACASAVRCLFASVCVVATCCLVRLGLCVSSLCCVAKQAQGCVVKMKVYHEERRERQI